MTVSVLPSLERELTSSTMPARISRGHIAIRRTLVHEQAVRGEAEVHERDGDLGSRRARRQRDAERELAVEADLAGHAADGRARHGHVGWRHVLNLRRQTTQSDPRGPCTRSRTSRSAKQAGAQRTVTVETPLFGLDPATMTRPSGSKVAVEWYMLHRSDFSPSVRHREAAALTSQHVPLDRHIAARRTRRGRWLQPKQRRLDGHCASGACLLR